MLVGLCTRAQIGALAPVEESASGYNSCNAQRRDQVMYNNDGWPMTCDRQDLWGRQHVIGYIESTASPHACLIDGTRYQRFNIKKRGRRISSLCF